MNIQSFMHDWEKAVYSAISQVTHPEIDLELKRSAGIHIGSGLKAGDSTLATENVETGTMCFSTYGQYIAGELTASDQKCHFTIVPCMLNCD